MRVYQECICTICKREYKYHYEDTKGHTRTKCNSCLVNVRRFALKDKCIEYKGGKCQTCGYDKCKKSMHFHHVDPSLKDFTISGAHARSWNKIKAELDKCILVCSNCHGEIHADILAPVV